MPIDFSGTPQAEEKPSGIDFTGTPQAESSGIDFTGVSPEQLQYEPAYTEPEVEGTDIADLEDEENFVPEAQWRVIDGQLVDEEGQVVEPTKAQAALSSFAYEASAVGRGIKQYFGFDEESLKQEAEVAALLWADPKVGGAAKTGAIAGMFIEPIGLAIPAAKANTLMRAVGKGSALGGVYAGGLYVEEGRSRKENVAMGVVGGGVLTGALRGISKLAQGRKVKKADKSIEKSEQAMADLMLSGMDAKTAANTMRIANPHIRSEIKKAVSLTGRRPNYPSTVEEAQNISKWFNSPKKVSNLNIGKGIDQVVGALSTRLGNIHPKIKFFMREYERKSVQAIHTNLDEAAPFMKSFDSLPRGAKDDLSIAIFNGKIDEVEAILYKSGGKGALADFYKARKVLTKIGEELRDNGRFERLVPNYFPRVVKNKVGLMNALNQKEKDWITDALDAANAKVASRGYPLSPIEEADAINKAIRGFRKALPEHTPGFAKDRTIQELNKKVLPFYEDPHAALNTYIHNATTDLEKFKFFGRGGNVKTIGEKAGLLDIDESVGSMIAGLRKDLNLSAAQATEVRHLIQTRFGIGEKASNVIVRGVKDVLYSALLANPIAAATQLGDLGVAMYINGMRNTLSGVAQTITGRSKLTVKELGLVDHIAAEFATTGKSAKTLNTLLKAGGFTAVDRLGKQTLINGALNRTLKQVRLNAKGVLKSKSGMKKFADKYAEAYGDDFTRLVDDLRAPEFKMTDRIKSMLFSELADVQPITRSEMPEMYLRSPNGRMLYMLKTFMLKQVDILRREGYNEIKKGNVAKGVYNIAKYGVVVGSANAGAQYTKDMMLGKDVEPEITDVGTNLLKTFALSEYTLNRLGSGKVIETLISMSVPPAGMIDKVLQLDPDALNYMPVAGKMLNYWVFDGLERFEEKQDRREDRDE